jgi:hypothetical protein
MNAFKRILKNRTYIWYWAISAACIFYLIAYRLLFLIFMNIPLLWPEPIIYTASAVAIAYFFYYRPLQKLHSIDNMIKTNRFFDTTIHRSNKTIEDITFPISTVKRVVINLKQASEDTAYLKSQLSQEFGVTNGIDLERLQKALLNIQIENPTQNGITLFYATLGNHKFVMDEWKNHEGILILAEDASAALFEPRTVDAVLEGWPIELDACRLLLTPINEMESKDIPVFYLAWSENQKLFQT